MKFGDDPLNGDFCTSFSYLSILIFVRAKQKIYKHKNNYSEIKPMRTSSQLYSVKILE